jgi:hypothetical protein
MIADPVAAAAGAAFLRCAAPAASSSCRWR